MISLQQLSLVDAIFSILPLRNVRLKEVMPKSTYLVSPELFGLTDSMECRSHLTHEETKAERGYSLCQFRAVFVPEFRFPNLLALYSFTLACSQSVFSVENVC